MRIEWNAFYNFLCNSLISLHPVLAAVPIGYTLYNFSTCNTFGPCATIVLHASDTENENGYQTSCNQSAIECVCVFEWAPYSIRECWFCTNGARIHSRLVSVFDESLWTVFVRWNEFLSRRWQTFCPPLSPPIHLGRHNKCRWCLLLSYYFRIDANADKMLKYEHLFGGGGGDNADGMVMVWKRN